jgi:predicted short-subunit dehydrogenase-like oxidoreductase (DUF2520 family)
MFDEDTTVGFVGAGRLGASLAVAMERAGYNVIAVHRRSVEAAKRLAARLEQAIPTSRPQDVADAANIVFVTAPDTAIREAAGAIDWKPGQAAVHCSGAMPVSLLEKAQGQGAAVGGMHPMQTFPTEESDDRFEGVTFGLESDHPALNEWLRRLAADLGGRYMVLRPQDRPAYHASAVMACGLMAGLVGLAAEMWRTMGRSREEATAALAPLVVETGRQISDIGIPAALTGPYVRGDVETVARHLDAVSERGEDVARAYAALALATLPLASEQGGLEAGPEEEIAGMLRTAIAAGTEKPG